MEFLTNIIGQRLTIGLRGKLDKNFKISKDVWDMLNTPAVTEIVFVLRKVEEVLPDSIDVWIGEIGKISEKGYDLTFIECPKSLVEPIVLKGKNFNLKSLRSFVIPYYCDGCNEEYPQLINTSSLALSFSSYSKPMCPNCGKHLSLDITEDELERIASLLPSSDLYSDKRKYPRFDVSSYNINVDVYVDSKNYRFKLVNFSEIGVALSGTEDIEAGTTVTIEIEKAYGEKIVSKGLVVWHSIDVPPNKMLGVSLESRDIFKKLIKL
jgi:hypothetical protein